MVGATAKAVANARSENESCICYKKIFIIILGFYFILFSFLKEKKKNKFEYVMYVRTEPASYQCVGRGEMLEGGGDIYIFIYICIFEIIVPKRFMNPFNSLSRPETLPIIETVPRSPSPIRFIQSGGKNILLFFFSFLLHTTM